MTWQELNTVTQFRDIVKAEPWKWAPYVNIETLDEYVENLLEEAGQ